MDKVIGYRKWIFEAKAQFLPGEAGFALKGISI